MSKENEFLIFAIEYYRNKKKMTGLQIAELFSKFDIYQMIKDNYFLYHIESPEHFVAEIDNCIAY
ncbi:MAG: DUF3791 domain-containing protein [Fibromonadaceae bacterium]|jgi:hypothetical protein|nr:DUF3791 domain-containing protein [Fibromonadaceae bacterium]